MHALSQSYILTPLCDFSLTQRPLVLGAEFCLNFCAHEDALVVIDGQATYDLKANQPLYIQKSPTTTKLLQKIQGIILKCLKKSSYGGKALAKKIKRVKMRDFNNAQITRLKVRQNAVFEKLDLEFKDGLSAISGASGVGKSVLIASLLGAFGLKESNASNIEVELIAPFLDTEEYGIFREDEHEPLVISVIKKKKRAIF